MPHRSLIIARKEVLDHLRDTRALASAILYTFMGPIIVGLVLAVRSDAPASPGPNVVLPIMAAVFALMAAFTGGMSLAMDTVAGERERRSLLPLLLSSASRMELVLGKWLAATLFAAAGLLANIVAFTAILGGTNITKLLLIVPGLIVLAALVAALEVLASTLCRNLKDAHTWLSILVFAAMAVGMFVAYRPAVLEGWWFLLPIAGHQRLLLGAFSGAEVSFTDFMVLSSVSAVLTVLVLTRIGRLFQRDEIIYGT